MSSLCSEVWTSSWENATDENEHSSHCFSAFSDRSISAGRLRASVEIDPGELQPDHHRNVERTGAEHSGSADLDGNKKPGPIRENDLALRRRQEVRTPHFQKRSARQQGHQPGYSVKALTKSLLRITMASGMICLGLFLAACSDKRITKANVDEVTEGMAKKQVESILGQPTAIDAKDALVTKTSTYIYRQGKDSVTISFKDDKVQSKQSTLSQ